MGASSVGPVAPGAWPSPITTALVVSGAVGLSEVRAGETDVIWSELRPAEGGRVQLVAHSPRGDRRDLLPSGMSARTRAHEYGGGAWWVHDDVVFFVNWDDQRLHRMEGTEAPVPITPEPAVVHGDRYADGTVTVDGNHVICVREHHDARGGEPANEIVAIPSRGGEPIVLVGGRDFVASPRVSPDGRLVAWLAWDHPSMPWDETELWVAPLVVPGPGATGTVGLGDAVLVAGGDGVSITQPEWRSDGVLHFISDASGWWNVVRLAGPGIATSHDGRPETVPVAVADAEVGVPAWVFAQSRYVLLGDGRTLVIVTADGVDRLGVAGPDDPTIEPLVTPFTALSSLRPFGLGAVVIGASFTSEPVVAALDVPAAGPLTVAPLRPARDLGIDPSWWSVPRHVTFATGPEGGGEVAHGLLYPPTNPDVPAPDLPPPLVVTIHGGPTSAARPQLSLEVQYWTSRGFAVLDVNYRGSTGYGRPFRDRLRGGWGVIDVEDCVAAVRHLAAEGLVDPERCAIRGGSAGGFTALCALTFHEGFAAGAVRYAVTDLVALATDTHKFEARYLDSLVGPLETSAATYRERSPVHHLAGLDVPLLVLQGLEDEVVPPSQAEALVAALDAKGVPHAYLAFEGEQHGFRRADTIEAALSAELYVLAVVLGLGVPEGVAPVPIAHR